MTPDEIDKDIETRQKKMIEQNGMCPCGDPIRDIMQTHLAHILKQGKFTESKYPEEVIHHPDNFMITHNNSNCNAMAQMNTNHTELVQAHIDKIKEAIEAS